MSVQGKDSNGTFIILMINLNNYLMANQLMSQKIKEQL